MIETATRAELKREIFRLRDETIAMPAVGDLYLIKADPHKEVFRVFPSRLDEVVAFYSRSGRYWSVPVRDWKDAVWKGEVTRVKLKMTVK